MYLIGSYKLVGDRSYGEKEKFDEIAMKAELEKEKARMMKEVHKKDEEKKGGKKAAKVMLDKNSLDDSVMEGLTEKEKKKRLRDKQIKNELKLEKDFNLAHDDLDKEREKAIKLRNLKDE